MRTATEEIRNEYYKQVFGSVDQVELDNRLYEVIGAMSTEIALLRWEIDNAKDE